MKKNYKYLLALFSILILGMGTIWASSETRDDYVNSYLTLESLADNNNVVLNIPAGINSNQMTSVSYSTDGINWNTVQINATNQQLGAVLNQGEKLYFKGLGKQCATNDITHYLNFGSTGNFIAYGNIMSLLYGDDFASHTEFPAGSINSFAILFGYNDDLVSAENLVLPATSLTYGCYYALFYHCDGLTVPPVLPATTLNEGCYTYMFSQCIALTDAPDLPAITMGYGCYQDMFEGCTSLTGTPALPATTLAEGCYYDMFRGCTSLLESPELPATTLAPYSYSGMFYECSSLTTVHEILATSMAFESCSYMFYGCSSLREAPALPATTLAPACYYFMFGLCSSLTEAPALPATEMEEACYYAMFWQCSSLTEAPELPATTLAEGCYYGMFVECRSLTEAPALPATTLSPYCYSEMFEGCSSLTTVHELPSTTLAKCCYLAMFAYCNSLTSSPELSAPVLVDSCYFAMFQACLSLSEVTCMATDISATDCVSFWLYYVAPTGTFYKAPEMEDWPTNSYSGIPIGWNVANYDEVDEQQDQIIAYPNPVKDKLHISGPDIQSVDLFDAHGRLIHSQKFGHAHQVELDFQGYAKGIYSVSIQSEGRNVNKSVVY